MLGFALRKPLDTDFTKSLRKWALVILDLMLLTASRGIQGFPGGPQ